MKTININKLYILLFCLLMSVATHAQPEENGGDPPESDVPLDGGTSILIATGIAYGAGKMRKKHQKNKK